MKCSSFYRSIRAIQTAFIRLANAFALWGLDSLGAAHDARWLQALQSPSACYRSESFNASELESRLRALQSLPPDVLAPRPRRMGTTQDYSGNSLREALVAPFNVQFPSSALENVGLIDVPAFERARMKFVRYGSPTLTLPLLLTLHTEHWLRAREMRENGVRDSRQHDRELMSAKGCSASGRITSNAPEEFVPPFI